MIAATAGAASRAAAARVLARVRFDGESLRAVLPSLADMQRVDALLDPRDRSLAESSVFAACRGLFRYEALLTLLLQKSLVRSDADVHALLLIGLTQLDALGMPAHAVVDACVAATRVLNKPRLAGLVNAILRRFIRERESLCSAISDNEPARWNHPHWLIDALRSAWGENAENAMLAGNQQPPLWLRINRRRTDVTSYCEMLAAADIDHRIDPDLPSALCLPNAPPARNLPGWDAGLVSVQDSSAQRAVLAMQAQPGMRVLDACAAPGGKTAALLETTDDLDLLAIDADPTRLVRIAPALARLGLQAPVVAAEVEHPERWWDGRPFDRILLDAPCSATGILRRQPDIRWHRRATDIAPLVTLQARMLTALWPLLKPGGRLVYATCSILPAENAAQINEFVAAHSDCQPLPLAAHFGRAAGHGYQRLPGEGDGDGFFIAALARG
ncbi:MAG: 16S rRNA (cytosine(967)-C(5))-methyltransferase RsmB [Pseudomarimonas sp.]